MLLIILYIVPSSSESSVVGTGEEDIQSIHKRMVRFQWWIKGNRTILLCIPCIPIIGNIDGKHLNLYLITEFIVWIVFIVFDVFIHLFILFIYLFTYFLYIHLFIYSFIYLFIYFLFIYLFIYLHIYLFIHSFIYLFIWNLRSSGVLRGVVW
jgi:hypothetical protein